MCRRLFLLFSFVVVLALASTTYGSVISDFNNPDDPNDGWALVDPNNPNIIVTNVDIGDANSLRIADSTGGGAELAITYSLVANNDVNEFRKHTKVSLDLTRLASEWGGQWGGWNDIHTAFTGYSELHLIIEAGRDVNDANGPPWSGGWNLLSQRANWGSWNGDDPINFTYDYSTLLNEIDFNNLGYLGFVLQTNWDYSSGGIYYLDNVQLVGEGMAYDPSPANHEVDVPADANLIWTPGAYADKHDVYFGTSFSDVNDANRANTLGVLVSQDQGPNTYNPGTLELGTAYYWRIDEVNDVCSPYIWKGEVWDFMTAYPGMGTVIGDWENGMNGWKATWQGDTTFSYSTTEGTVTLGVGDYSLGVQTVKLAPEDPGYWIIKRDGVLDLNGMVLRLDVTMLASEWGGEEVIVEPLVVQTDLPHTWSSYMPTAIDRNTGVPVASFFMPWMSTRGNAYRTYTFDFSDYSDWANANNMTILLALQNGAEGPGNFYLDNARLTDPRIAFNPRPANYATDVRRDPALAWNEGKIAGVAIENHDVYFGTDFNDVNDATRASHPGLLHYSENQDPCTYVPATLAFETTYYWRIDEVESPSEIYKGDVWSFTTSNYLVVDDFEDYNNTSNKIQDTWIKGGGGNVGYSDPDYAEVTIVHGDEQSMPFDYNNIPSPYYSEACAVTVGPNSLVDINDDWTAFGVKALSLWFRGWPASVGSWVESSGTHTITASGEDIWDVPDLRNPSSFHDEFHYAYKELTGTPTDWVTIEAKVESVSPTDPWAKAGVMIRQSLDPNSENGLMCITPEMGAAFQYRDTAGGPSTSYDSEDDPCMANANAPYWVKLEIWPPGFLWAYYSDNGSVWTSIPDGPELTALPIYVGLAVTSHNTAETCTAEFSNVSITAPGMTISSWSNQDIGIKSNTAAPLYVTLQDDATVGGDTATVTHTDPNIVLQNTWQAWDIALNDFKVNNPSLNLEKIKGITLGVGPADPCGTGTLYFDDIRLYKPRCMPNLTPDLTGDCFIDYDDLQILTSDWLSSPADSNIDLYEDDWIDLKDYAVLASEWFEVALWPY